MENTEQTQTTKTEDKENIKFYDELQNGVNEVINNLFEKHNIKLNDDCANDVGLENGYYSILDDLYEHLQNVIKNYGLNNDKWKN